MQAELIPFDRLEAATSSVLERLDQLQKGLDGLRDAVHSRGTGPSGIFPSVFLRPNVVVASVCRTSSYYREMASFVLLYPSGCDVIGVAALSIRLNFPSLEFSCFI